MSSAKVFSKGRVVIPPDVRESLGIRSGDVLDFTVDGKSTVVVRMRGEPNWNA